MSREQKSLVRLAVAWVICLAALAAFHFAAVAPHARVLASSRALVAAKAERFGLLRDTKSARGQQRLQEEQEELERRYADFVFSSEQMNELDFRIRALAEKSGVGEFSARHLGTVSKIGSTELKGIAQRDLALSLTGGFAEFLHFLNELERNQPVVLVDQFTLRAAEGKQAGLSANLDCEKKKKKAGK